MNQLHTALMYSRWAVEMVSLPPIAIVLACATMSLICPAFKQRARLKVLETISLVP